jgi:hypothetical protein
MRALADLHRTCWDWLDANRESFLLLPGEPAATRGLRLKAYAELMIFVTAALRRGASTPAIARLATFASASLEGFDWESQMIRDPRFVVALLTVVEFLETTGADASRFRALVERVLELRVVQTLDLTPYRRVEIERLLVRAGFAPPDPSAFARGVRAALALLDMPPPLWTAKDVYALTHVVFYLCEDGARDPHEILSPAEAARVAWLVRTFARIAFADRSLDLLAELLMCARFLGVEDTGLTVAGAELAQASRTADGGVPGDPSYGPFFGTYHSTLVWAFASVVLGERAAGAAA